MVSNLVWIPTHLNYLPLNEKHMQLKESISQLVLDIFTWNFWNLSWLVCFKFSGNLLKPFIDKKSENKCPIKTQCVLPEEEHNCQKTTFLVQKFGTVLLGAFEGKTYSCRIIILLLTQCIKMHKCNLHCPNFMFKGKLLMCKYWLRPLIHFNQCHFLVVW